MLSTNHQLRFNFLFCAVNCFIISDAFYFINVLSKTDLENFKIFYGISFIALSQKYHCNTASAWLQPHSWIDPQVMWKVLFLGFFLNKPPLFGCLLLHLICILNTLHTNHFPHYQLYMDLCYPFHIERSDFAKILCSMKEIKIVKFGNDYITEHMTRVDRLSLVLSGR